MVAECRLARYALTNELPVLWALDDSHYMAELRIQIPSLAGEMGHHKLGSASGANRRRRARGGPGWARAQKHVDGVMERGGGWGERRVHAGDLHVDVWLFKMPLGVAWMQANRTFSSLNASAVERSLLRSYGVLEEERSRLLDIRLDADV